MKRFVAILIGLPVLLWAPASYAASPVIDDLNGHLTPGFFIFAAAVDKLGWVYEPGFDYDLDGILTRFRAIPNPPVSTRTVTLSVYDEPPASGGLLLRSGTFTAGAAGGDLGIEFAPLSVQAGEDYFLALQNLTGLGLNIVDFGYASGPDSTYFTADDPGDVDFTNGWYQGTDLQTFHALLDSPGFAAPIFMFAGVPEPATALLVALAATVTTTLRRRPCRQ